MLITLYRMQAGVSLGHGGVAMAVKLWVPSRRAGGGMFSGWGFL